MYLFFSRPFLAIVAVCIVFSGAAGAQTSPSLRQAVDAAWALSPQARALQNRQAELDARDRAASSLICNAVRLVVPSSSILVARLVVPGKPD